MIAINKLRYYYSCYKFYAFAYYYMINKRKWKEYQNERLNYIIEYSKNHSLYYKNLLGRIRTKVVTKETLQQIPVLTKEIIRNERNHLNSDEIGDNYNNWRNTGGSTGEPLRFPALATPFYSEDICQMMLYVQMGFKPGDTIVSIDGSRVSDEDRLKNVFWKRKNNFPYGKYSYSTIYLDSSTFNYYWKSITELSPQFMRGYPSGFITLCKLMQEYKCQIPFHLKGVYLTSENFSQDDSDFISSVLKCPVYGQYGHTECSVFAVKKPQDQFYLCSPLYGYTEILNEKGNQVNVGEMGEIVVTGFSIAGLPFIRYCTGDLAIYGGETKYGETILTSLLGRTVDYIYNLNGEKVYTVGLIFGGHLKAFNYINSWQIEQSETGKLILRITKGKGYTDEVENELRSFFEHNLFRVEFQYVDSIPKTIRGKQIFLIQHIK